MSQRSDTVPGLNENHLRHIYATCHHIDRLLNAIEAALDPASHSGPFHRYEHVLSQQTRIGILEVLRAFRSTIGSVMTRHRIRLPPTDQDRFAIQSTVEFIDADIMELRPEYMGGYGELDEGARAELMAIVNEFSGHLSALRWVLRQDESAPPANEARDGGE